MVRTGIVKLKKGDMLRVCFETPEHCAGCRGCSRGFLPKHELLTVFGLFNTRLFVTTVLVSYGAFSLLYVLVYLITSRTYYRIVSGAGQAA